MQASISGHILGIWDGFKAAEVFLFRVGFAMWLDHPSKVYASSQCTSPSTGCLHFIRADWGDDGQRSNSTEWAYSHRWPSTYTNRPRHRDEDPADLLTPLAPTNVFYQRLRDYSRHVFVIASTVPVVIQPLRRGLYRELWPSTTSISCFGNLLVDCVFAIARHWWLVFSLLYIAFVFAICYNVCLNWHLTSYRPAQRAPLSRFLEEALYKFIDEWMNEWMNIHLLPPTVHFAPQTDLIFLFLAQEQLWPNLDLLLQLVPLSGILYLQVLSH